MLFCGLTKGISLKICILCVCVIINKHSFEPFCVWICYYYYLTQNICSPVADHAHHFMQPFPFLQTAAPEVPLTAAAALTTTPAPAPPTKEEAFGPAQPLADSWGIFSAGTLATEATLSTNSLMVPGEAATSAPTPAGSLEVAALDAAMGGLSLVVVVVVVVVVGGLPPPALAHAQPQALGALRGVELVSVLYWAHKRVAVVFVVIRTGCYLFVF